jgi:hypothetical protein
MIGWLKSVLDWFIITENETGEIPWDDIKTIANYPESTTRMATTPTVMWSSNKGWKLNRIERRKRIREEKVRRKRIKRKYKLHNTPNGVTHHKY